MQILSVADLKKHLNVDHNEDDSYIMDLQQVALDYIGTYLQRPIEDFILSETNGICDVTPAVRHAVRLLVGQWYANREPVAFASNSELPFGMAALLVPLKNFGEPTTAD